MLNPIRIPHIYSLGKAGFHWNIGAIWSEDRELNSAAAADQIVKKPVSVKNAAGRCSYFVRLHFLF